MEKAMDYLEKIDEIEIWKSSFCQGL